MRNAAPPTQRQRHRLTRLHRWAMLWLKWLAGFLDGAAAFAPLSSQAQAIAHGWLDRVEHLIVSIVMVRAGELVRPAAPRRHLAQHQRKTAGLRRAVIGARLRRALRCRDLRTRIDALRQDIDTLAALIARRARAASRAAAPLHRRRFLLSRSRLPARRRRSKGAPRRASRSTAPDP